MYIVENKRYRTRRDFDMLKAQQSKLFEFLSDCGVEDPTDLLTYFYNNLLDYNGDKQIVMNLNINCTEDMDMEKVKFNIYQLLEIFDNHLYPYDDIIRK